jgi:hypothetical protein
MVDRLIEEIITGQSKPLQELKANPTILGAFLNLTKRFDTMSGMDKRFYEEQRSLYQVTAVGKSLQQLEDMMKAFFGIPFKPAGRSLPLKWRRMPTINHLNGIKKEQVLFLSKLEWGEFYGALWPWRLHPDKIELHLGYCSADLPQEEYQQLQELTARYLSRETMADVTGAGGGGMIQGIGLPSFLQMAEMEGASFGLKVISRKNRVGNLHISNGRLVGASVGRIRGREAAYQIISWDNVAIQIDTQASLQDDQINQPLLHVLMESLKIKEEVSPAVGSVPTAKSSDDAAESTADDEIGPLTLESKRSVPDPEARYSFQGVIPGRVMGPFERPPLPAPVVDDARGGLLKIIILVAVVALVAGGVTFGALTFYRGRQSSARYADFIQQVDTEIDPDKKLTLLTQYLQVYPGDDHLTELLQRVASAKAQIEEEDYENVLFRVGRLPLDAIYEQAAIKIYTGFLERYPDSRYAADIQRAIAGIGDLLDKAFYERIKVSAKLSFSERFQAIQDYLTRFPNGQYRTEVAQIIQQMGGEYYRFLKKEAATCDETRRWRQCIDMCDNYLIVFENGIYRQPVTRLRSHLQEQQDLSDLDDRAEAAGADYRMAKGFYEAYLKAHPLASTHMEIQGRIKDLEAQVVRHDEWENLSRFAQDSNQDITQRIDKLTSYLGKHDSGPYADDARGLLGLLEDEHKDLLHQHQLEARRWQIQARQRQNELHQQQEAQRLTELHKSYQQLVNRVGGRFKAHDNGTVSDTSTGLVWTLLDSYQELNGCLNFNQALTYIQGLDTGGYGDWRLPTSGELASIYKRTPAFPATGAPWYWSSETYVKGYHQVANVVTPVVEETFQRQSFDHSRCGAVRAVRP